MWGATRSSLMTRRWPNWSCCESWYLDAKKSYSLTLCMDIWKTHIAKENVWNVFNQPWSACPRWSLDRNTNFIEFIAFTVVVVVEWKRTGMDSRLKKREGRWWKTRREVSVEITNTSVRMKVFERTLYIQGMGGSGIYIHKSGYIYRIRIRWLD